MSTNLGTQASIHLIPSVSNYILATVPNTGDTAVNNWTWYVSYGACILVGKQVYSDLCLQNGQWRKENVHGNFLFTSQKFSWKEHSWQVPEGQPESRLSPRSLRPALRQISCAKIWDERRGNGKGKGPDFWL